MVDINIAIAFWMDRRRDFLLGAMILVWRYSFGQMQADVRIALFAILVYFGMAVYITPLVSDYYARQGGNDVGLYITRGKEQKAIINNPLGRQPFLYQGRPSQQI